MTVMDASAPQSPDRLLAVNVSLGRSVATVSSHDKRRNPLAKLMNFHDGFSHRPGLGSWPVMVRDVHRK
jgi:hypothetical protein